MQANEDDDLDSSAHGFSNHHRAFLQALLGQQSMTLSIAKPILASIETARHPARPTPSEDITVEDLEAYLTVINSAISGMDLEVRRQDHQRTREAVWALVNSASDAPTQWATLRSADELAFIKRLLDAIFDTYNTPRAEVLAVNGVQAMKLAKDPAAAARRESQGASTASTGLAMSQAEKVLEQLVAEEWLEHSARGFYSLAPRALMELRGWLVDTYNAEDEEDDDDERRPRIKFCAACREIVTVGQRCPDTTCLARLHTHCVRKIFRAQQGREECPSCKKSWTGALPVGENAAGRSDGLRMRNGRQSNTNGVDEDSE